MTVTARSALQPRSLALVAAGGAAGAAARWAVVTVVETGGSFPWLTLLVNVAGCLGLGLLVGVREPARLWMATGFCGGLTTFSTFAVETAVMLDGGEPRQAAAYVVASVAAGIAAVLTGWRLALIR
ncbi:MAG: CrcB family protein [Acidimicrobiales bacterium]|nr:CrcB family protein [Acidimicrobiales bacterium]